MLVFELSMLVDKLAFDPKSLLSPNLVRHRQRRVCFGLFYGLTASEFLSIAHNTGLVFLMIILRALTFTDKGDYDLRSARANLYIAYATLTCYHTFVANLQWIQFIKPLRQDFGVFITVLNHIAIAAWPLIIIILLLLVAFSIAFSGLNNAGLFYTHDRWLFGSDENSSGTDGDELGHYFGAYGAVFVPMWLMMGEFAVFEPVGEISANWDAIGPWVLVASVFVVLCVAMLHIVVLNLLIAIFNASYEQHRNDAHLEFLFHKYS